MYLDSHYGGLGNSAGTLLKGTDCPENAAYLPGYDYDMKSFEPELRPDSMCIYEMINGETAWRHTTFSDPLGIPHVFLGVRSLHTVGNYDYNLETQFNLDGSITLNLDAAGYMATAYPSKYDSGYGVKVQQFQSGALHDHILGWKLDMDILGTANNFAETKIKVVANEGPTKSTAYTKKAVKKTIETEAGFTISHSEPNFFSIYNPTKLNKWGEPRGYYLSFEGSIRNLLPKDHPSSRAASWSNYNCMVTKRKEEEPYLSSEMNMLTARFPIVNASGFMDGESIIEEDLVLWIAIGKMHLPHSEDVPVVTNFGTTLDIRPRNYFDENAIFDIPLKSTDFSSCKPAVGEDFDYTPSEL
jgi:Cu2+-containing amine oxidase